MKKTTIILIAVTAAFVSVGWLALDSFGVLFLVAAAITATASVVIAIKSKKWESAVQSYLDCPVSLLAQYRIGSWV